MTLVRLSNSDKYARIDDVDIPLVSRYNWNLKTERAPTYYARATKAPRPYMHQLILPAPKGLFTCHLDGDGLNNTRANLRVMTPFENAQQRRLSSNNLSGISGVKAYPYRSGWWQVQLDFNGKRIHVGVYPTVDRAHAARLAAEIKYKFGGDT